MKGKNILQEEHVRHKRALNRADEHWEPNFFDQFDTPCEDLDVAGMQPHSAEYKTHEILGDRSAYKFLKFTSIPEVFTERWEHGMGHMEGIHWGYTP